RLAEVVRAAESASLRFPEVRSASHLATCWLAALTVAWYGAALRPRSLKLRSSLAADLMLSAARSRSSRATLGPARETRSRKLGTIVGSSVSRTSSPLLRLTEICEPPAIRLMANGVIAVIDSKYPWLESGTPGTTKTVVPGFALAAAGAESLVLG